MSIDSNNQTLRNLVERVAEKYREFKNDNLSQENGSAHTDTHHQKPHNSQNYYAKEIVLK